MRKASSGFFVLLLILAVFVVFFELGRMDVTEENEGQRVTPPFEMIQSGDYLVPTLNGEVYLAKPPLLYWAIAGVYLATGSVDEFTGRIPSAVASLILVLLIYLLFTPLAGDRAAGIAALAMLSSPYILEHARWAELDMPLTLFTLLSIMALYHAWNASGTGKSLALTALSGVCLAAATMLKGPVPYLFVAMALAAFLVVSGKAPGRVVWLALLLAAICAGIELARMVLALLSPALYIPLPLGLILFCLGLITMVIRDAEAGWGRHVLKTLLAMATAAALVAPWAIAVVQRLGWDYITGLLDNQVVERTYMASQINSGTPFFFLIALPFMLAPWGFLLPAQFSRRIWREGDTFYRFSVATGWLSVALFSLIAGKEKEYILPAVPFLLLPIGCQIVAFTRDDLPLLWERWMRGWRVFVTVLLTLCAVALPIYTVLEEFHWVLLSETILLGLFALAFLYSARHEDRGFRRIGAATALIVLTVLLTRSFHYSGERSPKDLALLCRDLIEDGYELEATKIYASFAFYVRHPVQEVMEPEVVKAKLAGEKPYFYLTREEFVQGFSGTVEDPPHIVAGPIRLKELLLLSNRKLSAASDEFPAVAFE